MKQYLQPSYNQNLVRQKRRQAFLKLGLIAGGSSVLLVVSVYFIFLSSSFTITNINVSGIKAIGQDSLMAAVNQTLGHKWLGPISLARNSLFFSADRLKADLMASFPEIKTITVSKKSSHDLNVKIEERTPMGAWCFGIVVGNSICRYFDEDGALWGKALESSGSLLLTVYDNRNFDVSAHALDGKTLNSIKILENKLPALNLLINKITIAENGLNDIKVDLSDYYLLLDGDKDVDSQLETLKILLDQNKDPNFKPKYLDLRIEGRVYYK